MQALDTSFVPAALTAHFENRRHFNGCHYENGWVRAYLSDDAIEPALAFVIEIPDSVSNAALSRVEESLYLRENIQHDHLGPVLERGRLNNRTVYWLVGIGWSRTLSDVLKEPHPNRTRLLRLMFQVGEGLQAMHDEGLCFGGLNEQGVFVGMNREGLDQAFLAGCSVDAWVPELRSVKTKDLDLTRARVLAPECAAGGHRSIASDIYAFGALLFRILTGRYPFDAPTTEELLEAHMHQMVESSVENVPEPLWSITLQCLRKDPQVRPESINQVTSCINDHLEGAYFVELCSADLISGDESSVPSSGLLGREDSEDLLSVISDQLDGFSDEESEKSMVEHVPSVPPDLPVTVEDTNEEERLEGQVPVFVEFEMSSEEASGEIPHNLAIEVTPVKAHFAQSGRVLVPTEVELEDELTDEVYDVQSEARPLAVVVGAVPFQSDTSDEEIIISAGSPIFEFSDETLINSDEAATPANDEPIDAFDINRELKRIVEDRQNSNVGPSDVVTDVPVEQPLPEQNQILTLDEDLVVEVVPEFSEEDTIFPELESSRESNPGSANVEVIPVMISEVVEKSPIEGKPEFSQGHTPDSDIFHEEVTEPLLEWGVELDEEITVKIDKIRTNRDTRRRGLELWNISLIDLVPNFVVGFVVLNLLMLFVTSIF